MKKLFIAAMMCLMGVIAQAQVITSETINAHYLSAIKGSQRSFAYNAENDDDGNITTKYVYKKRVQNNGDLLLEPVCSYHYEYAPDGVLTSRTMYLWTIDGWECVRKLDFTLIADLYTVECSRWNEETGTFDEPVEKISYTLHPDSSVHEVCRYLREQKGSPFQLSWHFSVSSDDAFLDDFLTER